MHLTPVLLLLPLLLHLLLFSSLASSPCSVLFSTHIHAIFSNDLQTAGSAPEPSMIATLHLAVAVLCRLTWSKAGFDEAGTPACQPHVKALVAALRTISLTTAAANSPRWTLARVLKALLLRTLASYLVLVGPSKRNPVPGHDGRSDAHPHTSTVPASSQANVLPAPPLSPTQHSVTSPSTGSARPSDGSAATQGVSHIGPSQHLVSHHELAARKLLLDAEIVQLLVAEVIAVDIHGDGTPCKGGVAGLFSASFGMSRSGSWWACDALLQVRQRFWWLTNSAAAACLNAALFSCVCRSAAGLAGVQPSPVHTRGTVPHDCKRLAVAAAVCQWRSPDPSHHRVRNAGRAVLCTPPRRRHVGCEHFVGT
jgi:hypothetical protein